MATMKACFAGIIELETKLWPDRVRTAARDPVWLGTGARWDHHL